MFTFGEMFAVAIVSFFLILFLLKRCIENKKLPPGPYGLPFIGYYPFLGNVPAETIANLSSKYGADVVTLNLFGDNYWCLNSFEAIKEAYVKKGEIFAGRYGNEFNFYSLLGEYVSGTMEGKKWKTNFQFTARHLSFLGAGKSTFEYKVHEFLDRVEEYVDSKQGKPNDYFEILTNFSSNVILSLCLTKDYKYDDPEYTAIRDAIHNIFTSFSCMNFLLSGRGYHLYSCLKPDQKEKWNTVNANVSILNHYVSGIIDERMKTFDRKNCNDLLDYYLNEANGENSDLFHKNAICDKIAELILGGTETTSALLYHALWLLAKHQNIQENMFQEINEKLGHNCLVSFVDKELFPYTNAVVSEIQRFVCLVPLVTTHVSREATTLLNFHVPKRQKIIANFYAVTRNNKYFKNPNEFDPENFLDDNGAYVSNEALIPFSTGVRKCIGAKLAEVDIFLAIVRLTQTFKWTCCENKNDDVTMVQEGLLRIMQSNKLCAVKRKQASN